MTFYGAASNSVCHRKRTAAEEVQALGSGTNGKAIKDTFTQDITSRCWFKSSSTFFSAWNDAEWLCGFMFAGVRGGAQ
jgi:hypothetical protein